MFKSLKIQNIQSHNNTFIKFHKGVNVIVGESDQGKSAIFNSMYWIMQNRPLGDEHRSWNGKEMLARLKMDNGTIQLKRDKQNIYTLNPKTDNINFKAFGQNPPQEITDLINMDKKTNIQQQLERGVPVFLLSESPGDVAKYFNRIANIDIIDTTLKIGKADLRKTDQEYKNTKILINDKEKELKAYEGIEDLEDKILDALKLEKRIKQTEKDAVSIKIMLNDIEELKSEIKKKQKKLKVLPKIDKALKLWGQSEVTSLEIFNLEQDIENIEEFKTDIKINKKKIKLLPKIKQALTVIDNMKLTTNKQSILEHLFNGIISSKKQIEYLNTKHKQVKLKFNKLMPDDFCPLCEQEMK